MSSRAAARLEAMGFTQVYDYVGGKKDWLAAGLPAKGERSSQPRAGGLARGNPPTCRPGDSVGEAKNHPDLESWGLCVVTDEHDVVHGLITTSDIAAVAADDRVEDVMRLGPTTIRPSQSIESALKRMNELEVVSVLVTTDFGELLGVLFREDAQSHVEDA